MGSTESYVFCLMLVLSVNGLKTKNLIKKRIIGGSSAVSDQFPYQVSVQTALHHQHVCGGAIIHENWILTTAHCVHDVAIYPSKVVAHVGSNELTSNSAIHYEISIIFVHPNMTEKWGRWATNDIALLRTKTKIQFIPNCVGSVKLPKTTLPLGGNVEVIISGWGSMKNAKELHVPNDLQYYTSRTISRFECRLRLLWMGFSVYEHNICKLNKRGTGVCSGDSGGPAVSAATNELVGIVAWGYPCARGFPDVFIDIHDSVEWIESILSVY